MQLFTRFISFPVVLIINKLSCHYCRSVKFAPEVLVKLDYTGKRVDLTHGPLAGLLMGLAHLNCSELRLKRLSHRHGLLGFDKLVAYLLAEWLQDIKKNQLPSLLGGVGPMHSLVQLCEYTVLLLLKQNIVTINFTVMSYVKLFFSPRN